VSAYQATRRNVGETHNLIFPAVKIWKLNRRRYPMCLQATHSST